jgi:hypothetical protein
MGSGITSCSRTSRDRYVPERKRREIRVLYGFHHEPHSSCRTIRISVPELEQMIPIIILNTGEGSLTMCSRGTRPWTGG